MRTTKQPIGNTAESNANEHPTSILTCAICGQDTAGVHFIQNESGKCICRDCALSIQVYLHEEEYKSAILERSIRRMTAPQSPMEIKTDLDKYVIGQEFAKKILSVAVYNHLVNRIIDVTSYDSVGKPFPPRKKDSAEVQRSNVILLGPTGCGKTELVRALGKVVKIPVETVDATTLTPVGFIGDSAVDVLSRIVRETAGNVAAAESGIIFIDEMDKLAVSRESRETMTRDVNGIAVQRSLLKFVEGCTIDVPEFKIPGTAVPVNTIDTSKLLFIGGGAFDGLLDITDRRINGCATGFGTNISGTRRAVTYEDVTSDDLIEYGFIPEFIGRFPILASLKALDHKSLVDIMTQPKNCLCAQYREIFDRSGIELVFTKDALDEIADRALKMGTGARGLRSILEKALCVNMYEYLGNGTIDKITITGTYIQGKGPAPVEYAPEYDDIPIPPPIKDKPQKKSESPNRGRGFAAR